MALAQRLRTAQDEYVNSTTLCKLASVVLSPRLTEEDVEYLTKVINTRPGDAEYVPNSRISQALRDEGFDVSNSAVDRHKAKRCSCYRKPGTK